MNGKCEHCGFESKGSVWVRYYKLYELTLCDRCIDAANAQYDNGSAWSRSFEIKRNVPNMPKDKPLPKLIKGV